MQMSLNTTDNQLRASRARSDSHINGSMELFTTPLYRRSWDYFLFGSLNCIKTVLTTCTRLQKHSKQTYSVLGKPTATELPCVSMVALSTNNWLAAEYVNYVLNITHPQSYRFMRVQGQPTTLYQYV